MAYRRTFLLLAAVLGGVAGCSGGGSGLGSIGSGGGGGTGSAAADAQAASALERRDVAYDIDDESFFDLFANQGDPDQGVVVNRYLWSASLDILSFLPIAGADPFSGLILTDWGRIAGDPTPFRVTVFISDPALDARSLKVAAFRLSGGRAVAVTEASNRQLENAILTRARQLRIAGAERGDGTGSPQTRVLVAGQTPEQQAQAFEGSPAFERQVSEQGSEFSR